MIFIFPAYLTTVLLQYQTQHRRKHEISIFWLSAVITVLPDFNQSLFDFFNHVDSWLKLGTHYPCSRAVNTGVILDTRVHGPWTRAVFTAVTHGREHGCNFWTPVNTARVNACDMLVTNTARKHRCQKWRPCSRPWTRVVYTGHYTPAAVWLPNLVISGLLWPCLKKMKARVLLCSSWTVLHTRYAGAISCRERRNCRPRRGSYSI